MGKKLSLENWEEEIGRIPCIAVTDSKSLFDTMQKCFNTSSHIEGKRTAIDVTVLKCAQEGLPEDSRTGAVDSGDQNDLG